MANKKTRNGPTHQEWYVDCKKCGGERRMTIVHGMTRKDRRPMCLGCHEFLPPDAKLYKK